MKNKNLILTADWHIDTNPHFAIEVGVCAAKYIIDQAVKTELRTVIVAGDITDKPLVGGKVLDALAEIFEYGADMGVQIIVLGGNHELGGDNRSVVSHLKWYKSLSHLTVVPHEPAHLRIGEFPIRLIPFGCEWDPAGYPEGLVIGHDDVVGSQYDSGSQAKRGIPRSTIRAVAEHSTVAMGHVHLPQTITPSPNLAFYIGAFLQFNFRAVGQDRRGYVAIDLGSVDALGSLERPLLFKRHPMVGGRWPLFIKESSEELLRKPPNLIDEQCCFVKIVPAGEHLGRSKDQIVSAVAEATQATEGTIFTVEAKREIVKVERKSSIQIDDSVRVAQEKYFREKLADESEVAAHIAIMDPVLKELGI
jgi:DNA repair exonuclease SbcCD nuclease subunit